MIEKFQQLPLATKVVIIVGSLSVVAGILFFVYFALSATPEDTPNNTPVPTATEEPTSGPPAAINNTPAPGTPGTPTPVPTPYDDGTLQVMGPAERAALEATFGLPGEELQAAYAAGMAGYAQYCLIQNEETVEARTARLTPYLTEEVITITSGGLEDFVVQDRDCYLTEIFPKSWDGTTLTTLVTVRMATVSASNDASSGLNDEGLVEDFASTVSLVKQSDGVWRITNIDDRTGVPVVSSSE